MYIIKTYMYITNRLLDCPVVDAFALQSKLLEITFSRDVMSSPGLTSSLT